MDEFLADLRVSESNLSGPLPSTVYLPQMQTFFVGNTPMEQWSNASLRNSRKESKRPPSQGQAADMLPGPMVFAQADQCCACRSP